MLLLLTLKLQKELHTIMDKWIVSFISASFLSLLWTDIPSILIVSLFFVGGSVCLFKPRIYPLSGFLFGCFWMASVGHWQLNWQLPLSQLRQVNTVKGQITSLVTTQQHVRFNFSVAEINDDPIHTSPEIRLSWRSPQWRLSQGQTLLLAVKLKPPRGLANEAGFNYQKWLYSQSIAATGYVRQDATNSLLENRRSLRQQLFDRIDQLPLENKRWINALSLGDRSGFSQEDWQLIQFTGIAHLVAISGLHLGIVASFAYVLFSTLVVLPVIKEKLPQKLNFHIVAMLFSALVSIFYAYIAGLQLPVLRACILLLIITVLSLSRSVWRPSQVLLLCLLAITVCFPMSLLSMSFWLSFSAVAILLFIFWRWPVNPTTKSLAFYIIQGVKVQVLLSLLMFPLIAIKFSFISLLAPLVNLFAVPLVTLLVVPLCLIGTLSLVLLPMLGERILMVVDTVIGVALVLLESTASMQFAVIENKTLPLTVWVFACFFMLSWLLPFSKKIRWVSILFVLPLLSWLPQSADKNWRVDVLDVGQGLAVLISRSGRALLFDTGASYPSGFNMADTVIVPVLKSRGINRLDKVIISHFDNDHAGSLAALSKDIKIEQVISPRSLCHLGWQAVWQSLHIEVLWPENPVNDVKNNHSCVVRVFDHEHQVLLTGDIEKSAEQAIMARHRQLLSSDIMVAPHHGSNTSSTAQFLAAVKPSHTVFSEGFMNRWNFPSEEVVKRYLAIGSRLYSTSEHGQVSFIMQPGNIRVIRHRLDTDPYWYAK